MANEISYKQYKKRDRRAVLETDFSKGMMSTDGVLDEGYVKSLVNFTFEKESMALTPRPGLDLSKLIFLDSPETGQMDFVSENVSLKATKECVENGTVYNQDILGMMDTDSTNKGTLWACTSLNEKTSINVKYSDELQDTVIFSDTDYIPDGHKAYFYRVGDSSIHNVPLSEDTIRRVEVPIGSFAFGNSFYFFGEETVEEITNKGLFRTIFNNGKYSFESVEPKIPSVSEAVTYGYNMLLGNEAYTFVNKHNAESIQFEGILPYKTGTQQTELMMTPKKNQPVDLVCYYDVLDDQKYDIVWESRETTASDWTQLQKNTVTFDTSTRLILKNFLAQDKEIMVRVSAYPYEGGSVAEDLVKAMVVGFDFTVDSYGSATAVEQKIYDLTTATGMASWKGRIVCWGVPEDPTILFISDYQEPSYFPYPNNITVFDEPIVCAVEFMDMLAVFTTDKLYSVTLSDDGNSFNSTILQSHLNIKPWDRHLIQTVRNMLYFKSGNYYYMMVPKTQSTTGELTLAPITTPITSFFDRFAVNVQDIFKNTYGYFSDYELLTYYNYLDYDDIHNVYVYSFTPENSKSGLADVVHFDVIYNTVDRTWKVWVYESVNILFPYRHDATQRGFLATTTVINVKDVSALIAVSYSRVIQIFKWNKLSVAEVFLPYSDDVYYYSSSGVLPEFNEGILVLPQAIATFNDPAVDVLYPFVNWQDDDDTTTYLQDSSSYFKGVDKQGIIDVLKSVFNDSSNYYTFPNYQFIDTGYRKDELQYKKRYRELQLQINNLDKKNLDFGMEYILDGAPRKLLYKYDTNQEIDEFNPEYGVVYVDATPYMEVDLNTIDLSNQWTLDQNLTPDISLWNIRVSISGKGAAPRFKLYSRNNKRFELLGINWISKIMHMR